VANIDGVGIWTSILDTFVDTDAFQQFLARYASVPMVSLGEIVAGIPSLIMDNYQGMYAAVAHLIEVHGCRRLAFVRGPEDRYYSQERYQACTPMLKLPARSNQNYLTQSGYPECDSLGKNL
jgi:DNA-binding LacI/PurR family transcriptional regulator